MHLLENLEISLEAMPKRMVTHGGVKPYRAHIIGNGFDHHAEADTPQEALILAATHWQKHSDKGRTALDGGKKP